MSMLEAGPAMYEIWLTAGDSEAVLVKEGMDNLETAVSYWESYQNLANAEATVQGLERTAEYTLVRSRVYREIVLPRLGF